MSGATLFCVRPRSIVYYKTGGVRLVVRGEIDAYDFKDPQALSAGIQRPPAERSSRPVKTSEGASAYTCPLPFLHPDAAVSQQDLKCVAAPAHEGLAPGVAVAVLTAGCTTVQVANRCALWSAKFVSVV